MNGNCLDIGAIQAFLDGETRPEQAVKLSEHVADCDACAIMLAQAEEENSLVYSVLDREFNTLVPTQRLWTRINDSISEEKNRSSFIQRFSAFVTTSFLNPSFTAAAGILLVGGMMAMIWNMNPAVPSEGPDVAHIPIQKNSTPPGKDAASSTVAATGDSSAPRPAVVRSNLSDEQVARAVRTNFVRRGPKNVDVVPASAQYLPGEESYIKTIGDLQQGVTVQNASMSASSQVPFARDMAVVDDSIRKMRDVVRKNPRNQAARQILYSSYQDKIDLLRSSAQNNELMASLR